MPTLNNVPKNYTIKQRLANSNGDIVLQPLYPKTTASQVVQEIDLRFLSDDERAEIIQLRTDVDALETSITDYIPLTQRGAANGVATLDGNAKIPTSQLPSLAVTETFVVTSEAAMLALTAQTGDVAVRTDIKENFILQTEPATTLSNWIMLQTPTDVVTSVNGNVGAVSIELSGSSTGTGQFLTGLTLDGMSIALTRADFIETELSIVEEGDGNAVTLVEVDDHEVTVTYGKTFVEGTTATGIAAGTYSVLTVGTDGRATAGAQIVEVGAAEQTEPSATLAVGGIFFQEV
jgi:hypothetical protein